jgi:hypothetical protein
MKQPLMCVCVQTFGITCIWQWRLTRNILSSAQQIVLNNWPFVFQLSSKCLVIILLLCINEIEGENSITFYGRFVSVRKKILLLFYFICAHYFCCYCEQHEHEQEISILRKKNKIKKNFLARAIIESIDCSYKILSHFTQLLMYNKRV